MPQLAPHDKVLHLSRRAVASRYYCPLVGIELDGIITDFSTIAGKLGLPGWPVKLEVEYLEAPTSRRHYAPATARSRRASPIAVDGVVLHLSNAIPRFA